MKILFITIIRPDIDGRFFEDAGSFEPVKATQIDYDSVDVEFPAGPFDFFCGPRPQEDGTFNEEDDATKFIVSDNVNEQNEYEVMRNNVIDLPDKSMWRFKLRLQFKGMRLDFGLIDEKKKKGLIDYKFCDGPSACVKWRIAVVPKDDQRILRKAKNNPDSHREKYQRFQASRRRRTAPSGMEEGV